MKRYRLVLIAAALAALACRPLFAAEPARPVPPRFSAGYMDTSADPRADFARYAFGAWQKNNPVPADKARWGSFNELEQFNQLALKGILEAAAARPQKPGSVEQKVGDFFKSAMNAAAIDAAGLKPVEADLARVAAIASTADLARALAALHDRGIDGFFRVMVKADQKKSEVNALYAYQGGMSLPSKGYYFDEQFEKFRVAFVEHVAKMLSLAGDTPESAAAGAKTVFEVEKALAATAKTPVELRDSLANYNKMPTADLAGKVAVFPLARYLADRGIAGPAAADVIVGQPKFFEGLQAQLASRPPADWRIYLRYHVLRAAAPYLAAPFEAEQFRFYGTVLRGTPAMEPRWQRSARVIDGAIGEALGQLYVERYYPPEAKARMDEMIGNVTAVMRDRLQKLEWMTEPTRKKALAKFERFFAKIGYPAKWRDYSSVGIGPGAYLANVRAATEFEVKRRLSQLGQPVDKAEWRMSPPTVNAYFDPTANNINFPAGILQPPFFDFSLDDAVNYGGIGAVIGHEITHGFDDQGRHFDAEGNLAEWWTPEDAARFEARARKMAEQFSSYEVLPGVKVNGELTLGENIADLGGVSLAYEALQRSLAGKERKLIDGFTPEQRFFLSWAQVWRTNMRENALRQQVAVDPHSPGNIRAIGPLVNVQPFYDAFGIKEGDPMWRKPEDRSKIW
ncbi:MAG TPA: M13 family metallopeptidase [Burkholderiales bacterium]|nr:M13 family metallopeptidase [Burkholderiales bacterium]